KEKRISKTEVVFESASLARCQILCIVPHCGDRNVNALPASLPQFPTQIHVFAVHEEGSLIESTDVLESLPANEYGGSRTPGSLTGAWIVDLRMLPRLLARFAHGDGGIGLHAFKQLLETTIVEFGVGIEQEYEFGRPLPDEQIDSPREAVVG